MSEEPLSIAHIHWGFPPIIGGVETHLILILPALKKLGHKVSLLTCEADGYPLEEEFRGVKIKRSKLMDLNWLVHRGLDAIEKEVRDLFYKFVEEEKPDILHAHNMHYFSKAHAQVLEEMSKEKGIPLILTAHNAWDDPLGLELATEIDWTHIISVSHFIEREFLSVGCDPEKVTTVHHGIDVKMFHSDLDTTSLYKKYPQLKGRRILLHPARMGLAKGCDVSIKALRIIKEHFPDVILILGGSKNIVDWELSQQKDISYFQHLIERFKLWDNVLIDSFALDEMPQLYAASSVCVYPSTAFEPFGLAMLEALATKRPIIVTSQGGMPEIIDDGINGFVIPPKRCEELASRVMQLFSDESLRKRLGRSGRKMVEHHFTTDHVTHYTLEVYRSCLSGVEEPAYQGLALTT